MIFYMLICTLKYECAFFAHHRHSGFYMHVPIGKKLSSIYRIAGNFHGYLFSWKVRKGPQN